MVVSWCLREPQHILVNTQALFGDMEYFLHFRRAKKIKNKIFFPKYLAVTSDPIAYTKVTNISMTIHRGHEPSLFMLHVPHYLYLNCL